MPNCRTATTTPLGKPPTNGRARATQKQPTPKACAAPFNAKACPSYLSEPARVEWRRIAPELARSGKLATIDADLVAAYSVAFARWREAEARVAELGVVVKSPAGVPIENPYLGVAGRAFKDVLQIGRQLGLSPTARGKLRQGG